MSVKIYCLYFAVSDRVVWLCEELSELVPTFKYELIVFPRGRDDSEGKKTLLELHPSGTAPTLVDTNVDPPITMTESGAIIDYIIHVYGEGHFSVGPSAGTHAYSQYLYWYVLSKLALGPLKAIDVAGDISQASWTNFAPASFQAFLDANLLSDGLTQKLGAPGPEDFVPYTVYTFFKSRTAGHLKQYETRLSQSKYLAGDELTAAEFISIFSFTTYRAISPFDLSDYPNILRWLKDITSRPAYKRLLEKVETGIPPLIQANVPRFPWEVIMGIASWKTVPGLEVDGSE